MSLRIHNQICTQITEVTSNTAVYAMFVKNANANPTKYVLEKNGSICNLVQRITFYNEKKKKEQYIEQDIKFVCIFDLDNVSNEFYSKMEELYKEVMNVMMMHEHLEPIQRLIFTALHKYEGEKLGPKRTTMLQMIEYGCQTEFKKEAPAEFLMCDKRAAKR